MSGCGNGSSPGGHHASNAATRSPQDTDYQGRKPMKLLLSILTLSIVALGFTGCADDALETGTSSLALSDAEGEALETCIADLEECRATTETAEEFREVCGALHACLPDR